MTASPKNSIKTIPWVKELQNNFVLSDTKQIKEIGVVIGVYRLLLYVKFSEYMKIFDQGFTN